MEQFQKAVRKVRQVQRMRKQRGYAFSQTEQSQARVLNAYDTTRERGRFGELKGEAEWGGIGSSGGAGAKGSPIIGSGGAGAGAGVPRDPFGDDAVMGGGGGGKENENPWDPVL